MLTLDPLTGGEEILAPRRTLLRRVTEVGVGLFGGLAALGADEAAAYAYACCGLARDNKCSGCSTGNFSCPSGYSKRYWYCCQGGQLYGCGECAKGSNCYTGPFACSCGYRASGPCQG
jgi:hypothetical protein